MTGASLTAVQAAFIASASVCAALLLHAQIWKPRVLLAETKATQALHDRPTPRLGGVAIFVGLCLGLYFLQSILKLDLLASLAGATIIFAAGLAEDITRRVTPRIRLAAAFLAAGIACVLGGQVVSSIGFAPFDLLLSVYPIAVLATLVWSAGMCHAMNLIDGINGFAAGYVSLVALALCWLSHQTGDDDIQAISLLLVAAVGGFLLFNWPSGLIFLGDAGAYTLGHILAWLAIILAIRNPDVSGMALLLIFFWPMADTAYAIVRRRIVRKPTNEPDRLHFHHLVMRILELRRGRGGRISLNSLSALIVLPLAFCPILAGVLLINKPGWAALVFMSFAMMFVVTYRLGVKLVRRRYFRRRKIWNA